MGGWRWKLQEGRGRRGGEGGEGEEGRGGGEGGGGEREGKRERRERGKRGGGERGGKTEGERGKGREGRGGGSGGERGEVGTVLHSTHGVEPVFCPHLCGAGRWVWLPLGLAVGQFEEGLVFVALIARFQLFMFLLLA